jgi:isoleucyl-tRNA synthetase
MFLELRPFVMKALEAKRGTNEIGSPLEAKVVFRSGSPRDLAYLEKFKAQLPSLLIVSQVTLDQAQGGKITQAVGEAFPQMEIAIEPAEGVKCSRCWNYSVHVGETKDHPTLCERCVPVVRKIQEEADSRSI